MTEIGCEDPGLHGHGHGHGHGHNTSLDDSRCDYLFEEGYASSGRQLPMWSPYCDPYNWAIPLMHEQPHRSQTSNQLASLVESQKQLMIVFKDVAQRIGTLENTIAS